MKGLKCEVADVKISRGGHVCLLSKDGFVYSWGSNDCGQLGLGDTKIREAPKKVKGLNNIN